MVKWLTNKPVIFIDSLEFPVLFVRSKCLPNVDVSEMLLHRNWTYISYCSLKLFMQSILTTKTLTERIISHIFVAQAHHALYF